MVAGTWFQGVLGRRKQDYHADAPPLEETQQQHNNQNAIGTSTTRDNNANSITPRFRSNAAAVAAEEGEDSVDAGLRSFSQFSYWQRLCVPEIRRDSFSAPVLNSHAWKAVLTVFSAILLFGEQIRELFLPPSADNYVDAVFVLVLVFFSADILMRCDVEDNYFVRCRRPTECCGGNGNFNNNGNINSNGACRCGCCCSCGSFLFWCDLLSTLTLFYDISWIGVRHFSELSYDISLGNFGVPVRRFFLVFCHASRRTKACERSKDILKLLPSNIISLTQYHHKTYLLPS